MLNVQIVTLFPEFFTSPLSCGLMARARAAGLLQISFINPRTYSTLPHQHVDDTPYGGGPGMIMQAPPVAAALRAIPNPGRIVYLTPRGRPFTQDLARELACEDTLTFLCTRYEGLDGRVEDLFPLEPICLTDAVLNSGDSAALAVLEAIARLRPGFMGKASSGEEESFSDGLLEYPQYTRPEVWEGHSVPEVLRSGHHAKIAEWRRAKALELTRKMRPDLLARTSLSALDCAILAQSPALRLGRNLAFCLVHHPVRIDGREVGTSSLTNLDIHDISRISASYGLAPFYVVQPQADQQRLLSSILRHWLEGPAKKSHPDRARALEFVRPCATIAQAVADLTEFAGLPPLVVASSAKFQKKKVRYTT
ncbi:MAG: tRNA (guanosine(37)-N1)-methyltransferase TrmD, partial [Desulfovibrio sp.]|nr:tRNA (guanosine(37)-N1)-methyltransferase TrmD [Desulfovibrio sp.]